MTLILLLLCITPSIILDICNLPVCPLWEDMIFFTKDLKILGLSIIAYKFCSYKKIEIKALLFFLCLSQYLTLIINQMFSEQMTPVDAYIFMGFYTVWVLRLRFMRKIEDRHPGNHAFYILYPVSTIKGLLQAVFLPWHCPRYETRMISDGTSVWLIDKGVFVRKSLAKTKFDVRGVRVPLGRFLTGEEHALLNGYVGGKAIPGLFDCRKFLIAGRV